jgi:hypothetical protein
MRPVNFVTGVGMALGAAYLFDPQKGRRRRMEIAQKLGKFERRKARAIRSAWEDTKHRMSGGIHEMKSAITNEGDTTDQVIEARIRSKIGRSSTHPSAIEVCSTDGFVKLSGPVLQDEVANVVQAAKLVKGVKGVENAMSVHANGENISALQGAGHIPNGKTMKPSTALAVGAAGIGLALAGLAKRGTVGKAMGLVGMGMIAKGLHDVDGNRSFNV